MDIDPASRRPSIPRRALSSNESASHGSGTRCCCGSECTEHGASLRSLEKDVRDAARVGQALLIRHETYVAEAETERSRLNDQVTRLEKSNKDLEARNAQLVAENSALLDQVDDVHAAVHQSEVQIQSLTATLHSTQRELDRVTRLAARTETLEAQLLECEKEQARLQATLARSNEEERAALQKWRNSHRRILELEEQIEDIEREARDERARHEEVEERFERRRAVEKELETSAAGRAEGHEKRGSEVVSSFVKEILQDNANMQLAMVELQDLLAYYKEAELLQGANAPDDFEDTEPRRIPNLSDELGADHDQAQRQVHVHHHYHAPQSAVPQRQSRSRSQQGVRTKKRRPILVSGRSTPINLSQSPQRVPQRHKSNTSTSSSVGSFDNRISRQKRWSAQSMQSQSSMTISSGPSSPRSTSYCPSTIFEHDLADGPGEYSRPTSPESNAVWSPSARPVHRKLASNDSSFQPMSLPSRLAIDEILQPPNENSIATFSEQSTQKTSGKPDEEPISIPKLLPQLEPATNVSNTTVTPPPASPVRASSPRRPLRRTESHTSLFSISGMDIHSTFPSPSHAPSHNHPISSRQQSGAILTATSASAMKTGLLNSTASSQSLRGRLGANGVGQKSDHYSPLTDTFGTRIGGWLTSRWAPASSTRSNPNKRAVSAKETSFSSSRSATDPASIAEGNERENNQDQTAPVDIPENVPSTQMEKEKLSLSTSPQKLSYRPPGVNQDGGLPPLPLPGGFRLIRTPITRMVDEAALKECLEQTADLAVHASD